MDTTVYRPILDAVKLAVLDVQVPQINGKYRYTVPRHARSHKVRWSLRTIFRNAKR